MVKLSIAILTFNEEKRIGRAISSVSFADEIIVMDSGSTDQTIQIAQKMGAKVFIEKNWQGFAIQRTRLLSHANGEYVLFLDADEEITPPLRDEILNQINSGQDAIWEILWDQIAFGRSLKRMKTTGGIPRMFKRSSLKGFDGVVHEAPVMSQNHLPIYKFKNHLLHYSRESVYESLIKLTQYSQLGAFKRSQQKKQGGIIRGSASGLWIFIRLYIFNRGFLCGAAGFLFCLFIALECFFRYAILKYDTEHANQMIQP